MKKNKMGVHVRTFRYPEDYDQVYHLWEIAGPGISISPSDAPEEIEKKILRDPDLFLVATDQSDKIIGSVIGGFDGRRGMVYHLAVLPTHRKNNIGFSLMKELEKRLRQKGCIKYYLMVTQENQEAMGFYEKIGFQLMDVRVLGKLI